MKLLQIFTRTKHKKSRQNTLNGRRLARQQNKAAFLQQQIVGLGKYQASV